MDFEKLKDVRVLLIDDDEDDYLIIKKIFEQIEDSPFILEWVSSFDESKKIIRENRHDAYLVDYRLGEYTGLDVLKFAKPHKRSQPFILLTGVGNETVEWKSMQLAASDYLTKGTFDANLLSRTLYYSLQRKKIEEQRIQHFVELNRSKDEFISIASHQLRTPATGVKQYLGMLLEGFVGELDPQQRIVLEKAYQGNERQLKIVSDLLKVAQVDAGKIMLRKSPVLINELVEDVIREQQSTFTSRHQTVSHTAPQSDVPVKIDRTSIRMVLENVIDNASKYSEEHTHIEVSVEDGGDNLLVVVRDEGVGINPKIKSRLFEKFSRLDNPLSTKVGGTGLGLYWAKKIVDLHGGSLTYAPNKSRGSIFTIRLPKYEKV